MKKKKNIAKKTEVVRIGKKTMRCSKQQKARIMRMKKTMKKSYQKKICDILKKC